MTLAHSSRYALGCSAILALLVGCAAAVPSTRDDAGFTGGVSQSGSGTAASATSNDLLYISDGGGYVYLYTYPGATYVSKIEILNYPSGLCADKAGNVFVTLNLTFSSGNGEIVEYAHGGNRPIATLYYPNARPLGCAVDETTGNLAVTSYAGQSPSESGSVAIFQKASGGPQTYSDPKIFFYDFCTYDSSGDLFVDGQDVDFNPVVAELPKGGSTFTNLTLRNLPKKFGYPGDILWNGKGLAFGDFDHSVIYQLRLSGSTVSVVGSTRLASGQNVEQFSIVSRGRRATLIGPNARDRSVMFWNYPAGGQPTKAITGLDGSFGTAISKGTE